MASVRTYQVCLYSGPTPPPSTTMTVIDVTPASASAEDVLAKLRTCGIKPADLRARTIFLTDSDTETTLAVYAALIGFSGRRIDVASGSQLVEVTPVHEHAKRLEDLGKPSDPAELVQVGRAHPDVVSVPPGATLDEAQVTLIRYARKLRFVPIGDGVLDALNQFLLVSGIRVRNEADRLPVLVKGDEPVEVAAEGEEEAPSVGLDLDHVRREAIEFRRTQRFDERSAVAERVEPSARQRTLLAAAALPLGAQVDADSGLWHCPRPDRHTNGDANASLKAAKGTVRCYRCDAEPVDSLRLTTDVLGASADEAADWLLSEARLARLSYPGKPA
jgi:hypothetical protein